jgi:MFS family permease
MMSLSGLGWSLTFISVTAILNHIGTGLDIKHRGKLQGLNDTLMQLAVADTNVSSGFVIASVGMRVHSFALAILATAGLGLPMAFARYNTDIVRHSSGQHQLPRTTLHPIPVLRTRPHPWILSLVKLSSQRPSPNVVPLPWVMWYHKPPDTLQNISL